MVDSESYARALTKQAVAHVCISLGFSETTTGSLDILVDVVQSYVEALGKQASASAERAGRAEVNLADVLQGFEQMPQRVEWRALRDFAFSDTGVSGRGEWSGLEGKGGGDPNPNPPLNRWDQPFHSSVPVFPQ
ncbi:unnamed protein product, partial [Discosporangium mesarthrocarpum]